MNELFTTVQGDFYTVDAWIDYLRIKYGSNIAVRMEHAGNLSDITYAQFQEAVRRCAALVDAMYDKDAHIGIRCVNRYECFLYMMAVICSGRVAVLLDDITDDEMIEQMAKEADCCDVLLLEHMTKVIAESQEMENPIAYEYDNFAEKPAIIYFTSGTSGHKWKVLISHYNITCSLRNSEQMYTGCIGKCGLAHLPLYHMYGFMAMLWDLSAGGIMVFNEDMKYLARNLKKYKPYLIETVPLVLEFLYKKINLQLNQTGRAGKVQGARFLCRVLKRIGIDIRKKIFAEIHAQLGGELDVIIVGGGPLDIQIINFCEDIGITVLQGYGMTELSTFASVCTLKDNRVGSVGKPAPYNDIRIVDGEIQVRGINVMLQYYGEEEATANAFDGEWFRTGDLGYLDEDGYLYITGRKKNLIIMSNGENVSPEVVENELLRSTFIDEVIVSERAGAIHAEIYSEELVHEESEAAQAAMQTEVDAYNRNHDKSMYVRSFGLRKEPFEKTVTMKIVRKPEN